MSKAPYEDGLDEDALAYLGSAGDEDAEYVAGPAEPFHERVARVEEAPAPPPWEGLPVLPRPGQAGMVAALRPRVSLPVLAAPSVGDEVNTVALPLRPIACFRLDDARFEVGSSFVRPSAAAELALFAALWERTPARVASVFGHADATGSDEDNKALSGRRAKVVFALLSRRADLWEEVFSAPLGSDVWGDEALRTMRGAARPGELAGALPRDAEGRRALFLEYMEFLCRDEAGRPFALGPESFLGRGQDPSGEADYQGCGEHNPLLVLSREEERGLLGSPRADRAVENAPNRRVVVYLFDESIKPSAGQWPCPRAGEPARGCRAHFWPDGDRRRSPSAERREHSQAGDTFACSFYDRLARRSPCETVPSRIVITLFDHALRLLPGARYRLWLTGTPRAGPPDHEGVATQGARVVLPEAPGTARCHLEWAPSGTSPKAPRFPYRTTLHLGIGGRDAEAEADKRLHNLGYHGLADTFEERLARFQQDYRVSAGEAGRGRLDDATREALWRVHDEGLPKPA